MEVVEADRLQSMDGTGGDNGAATRLQKVYRSYQTRRKLADAAVDTVGELWWQALDFARLSHSTVSFFDKPKIETASSRWNRVGLNASKVGQGSSRDVDGKADKMAFEYRLEAIDPRHRYGRSLHFYYDVWCQSKTAQPFFYWLDVGEGKHIDLPECSRALLKNQCIRYLGPQEREHYEYIINEGKIIHKQSEEPLDTSRDPEGTQWIFVMSTTKRLYIGKGTFFFYSAGTIATVCYFHAAKSISTYPSERERCIPALQLFGRRCNHSCRKNFCGKWSYQVHLGVQWSLQAKQREHQQFHEFPSRK